MKLSPKDKIALSSGRFDKAREFFHDAEANLAESRLKTAVNRAYYAALNAVRALLILEGVDPETHSGAITTLSLRFIKTGLLPVDIVKSIKLLLSRRTDVDYGDFDAIETEDAADSVTKAAEVLKQIDTLRLQMIRDLEKPERDCTRPHLRN